MFLNIPTVVKQLKTHYPPNTPVALVQHAGYQDKERVIRATLDTILDAVKDEKNRF